MTRLQFIEQSLRQIYGGHAPDDGTITNGLVNQYLNEALGIAAKKNYTDNIQLEGVGYVNNSFYTTFKGIVITPEEKVLLYKLTLPQIPLGIGTTDGISRVIFKDRLGNVSFPGVALSENQVSIYRSMRVVPNKTLFYPEGIFCYMISTLNLTEYTATITMVSGGDSTNLDSVLNIPDDYKPNLVAYIKEQLNFERNMPVPSQNDGQDSTRTT